MLASSFDDEYSNSLSDSLVKFVCCFKSLILSLNPILYFILDNPTQKLISSTSTDHRTTNTNCSTYNITNHISEKRNSQ